MKIHAKKIINIKNQRGKESKSFLDGSQKNDLTKTAATQNYKLMKSLSC